MREEARDLKQISYKLENKVVELTQTVGKLRAENKTLLEKVESFDTQVKSWRNKHNALENRNKELQIEANQAGIASAKLNQMDQEMKALQRQFDESAANMKRLQEEGKALRESLSAKTSQLDQAFAKNKTAEEEKQALRAQIAALEDALENAGPAVSHAAPEPSAGIANGLINLVSNKKPKRRSADVGAMYGGGGDIYRSSYQTRPVSMMPNSMPLRNRDLDLIQYAPIAENSEYELQRILEDEDTLNEEVSMGLIRNLKIPAPNNQAPLQEKEVLFPAYLINVVTSEMWNNGFVKESERFLANVMQSVQTEVMVSLIPLYYFAGCQY